MFRLIDLFAGAGGFSRGFREEGFRVELGIESMSVIAETYAANFPEATALAVDIREVHSAEIIRLLGRRPDIVIGGPPCEGFTRANPRRRKDPYERLYDDPLGSLVLHFIRIVGDLEPKVFVMENVPGIMDDGLDTILRREFAEVGYSKIYFNILRAEEHGTPSQRTRVFISNIPINPPKQRKVVVYEALKDLPPPDPYYGIPNHEPVPLGPRRLKRISKLKWGEPLVRYRGYEGRVLQNVIRLHPYRVAPTVMGSSRFIHPFEDRLLTVREQARLMGFPDDHVFLGGRDLQFNQVGEAVPVPLARAIAKEVKKYLTSES
ncbi:DNA cytosine methyltransferase [Infirmifilum lucidum]|uniref:DNA (cytosine-5-)-methyltransferase n=1 Tax=Infirmifilum lucidum TaxID=2776706 RepID=A0A7L9FGS8_9CREN|nr:DNA cytosine methyltransferase [Infirmifilum lucidum]QOJ78126.1 DNA cytosine methyltransferase [Infirmifilum lucidum]